MHNMQNMQNMANIERYLHRYVRTIKAHADNATDLPKGKRSTRQPVLVLGIAICRVILGTYHCNSLEILSLF
jgi:hypothetical protein